MHDEIELALKKANKCINSRNTKTIIIKTDDGEIRLRHDDIMYFEMYRRRITVYTNDGKAIELKERKTIKSLYEELEDEDFVQIHSGGIVNVKYIYEYSGYSITLDNETKLIVSRSRLKEALCPLPIGDSRSTIRIAVLVLPHSIRSLSSGKIGVISSKFFRCITFIGSSSLIFVRYNNALNFSCCVLILVFPFRISPVFRLNLRICDGDT